MKDIILVGTGKASLLHYNSYKKIEKHGNIYFCDIKKQSSYIKGHNIYSNIQECINTNNLNTNNLIVDICTPKSEFLDVIDECYRLGIIDVLVEKPFVIDEETYRKYKKINIVMIENYLFSKLTKLMKNYLDENNKEIKLIYTNFSKNRIAESANNRGFHKKATLNYEIEIPHQIYLTQYFLNNPSIIENNISYSQDMEIENRILSDHGYGLIISKFDDTNLIYESNLTSNIVQKMILICTKDDFTIEGNYAIYSKDLKLIKPANMKVYYKGTLISNKYIKEDDNFYYFIKASYLYFNNCAKNPNFVDIFTFSNIMNLYCSNLLNNKEKVRCDYD